jgi:hypothetical protein
MWPFRTVTEPNLHREASARAFEGRWVIETGALAESGRLS